MTETAQNYGMLMLILGTVTILSIPMQKLLGRASLPGMIGFIGIGLIIAMVDDRLRILTPFIFEQVEVLAQLGIIALLFRFGIESSLDQLLGQLQRAIKVWLSDAVFPPLLVFALIWFWPGLGAVPALLVAIAASATSVGVSVTAWENANALDTPEAALMLDVAELDDLSAVILLGIVFAITPHLHAGEQTIVAGEVLAAVAIQVIKIAAFCGICFVFSRQVEERLSKVFVGLDKRVGPFAFAAGTVFLIAALAEKLGFSMAIGALFAGLAFSRDAEERQIDRAFGYFLTVFAPFFFVSIGLSVALDGISAALPLAFALLAALIAGKLLGAGLAAWAVAGRRAGLLIGASMIPRAEIYLIVMLHGLTLGSWAMPQQLYTAAVLASIGTCLIGPLATGRLLVKKPTKEQKV